VSELYKQSLKLYYLP